MNICKLKGCLNKVTNIQADMCKECLKDYIVKAKKHWTEGTNGCVTVKLPNPHFKAGQKNANKWIFKKQPIIEVDEKGNKFWSTFTTKKYIQGKEV